MAQDYYSLLGVSANASGSEIKSAFRKMAKKYHPDTNRDNAEAEKKFKEINQAYEVLQDDNKRAAYDRVGHEAFVNNMSGAGRAGAANHGNFNGSMSDIFESIFGDFMDTGQARGGNRRARGRDISYKVDISLEEAYKGKTVQIKTPVSAVCDTCGGERSKPGTSPSMCGTCRGAGKIRTSQGFFTMERTCNQCQGQGKVITDPCTNCKGSGFVKKNNDFSVDIPAGVDNGTNIRLTGKGDAGFNGGPPGDLYLIVEIRIHDVFQRDGNNLYAAVPISIVKAALGGAYKITALDGKEIEFKVTAGTQSGRQFRIKDKGMPYLQRNNRFGDLYVQINVETPVKLTDNQKKLLEDFENDSKEETYPETKGFMARMKNLVNRLNACLFM